MGTGPTVGHYQFDAWDLPTKHSWMHSGPGGQAATRMQDLVNRMAERMIASGELVGRLLGGAQWAGAAATAAGHAMRRGASQINQAAGEAAIAERCVTELGESFEAAQRRVPSPNEIPTGLGDRFLYGAAEGINALSPFDVQSPLHDAMEQRRELDQQATLALTDHMITSRERVEAIPAVAAPGPMAVSWHIAEAPGSGVGQPAGVVPTTAGFDGAAPAATTTAGWAGTPAAPASGSGPGAGGAPFPPAASPASTGLMGAPVGVISRPQPVAVRPTGSGADPGGAAFGTGSGGRVSADGAAAVRGRAGLGVRPESIGDGIPRHAAVPGRDGLIREPATAGPRGVTGSGAVVSGGSRAGVGSFLQPPVGGHGNADDDTEHTNRYAQQADHIVGELPLVAPAVIGETPDEQRRRLGRGGQ